MDQYLPVLFDLVQHFDVDIKSVRIVCIHVKSLVEIPATSP
jgi:hypothetical protein